MVEVGSDSGTVGGPGQIAWRSALLAAMLTSKDFFFLFLLESHIMRDSAEFQCYLPIVVLQ